MKALSSFVLLVCAGLAQAGQTQAQGIESIDAHCGKLLTETECFRHVQTLDRLSEPAAREVYLAQHRAMLHEREVMCGRPAAKAILARAQYR